MAVFSSTGVVGPETCPKIWKKLDGVAPPIKDSPRWNSFTRQTPPAYNPLHIAIHFELMMHLKILLGSRFPLKRQTFFLQNLPISFHCLGTSLKIPHTGDTKSLEKDVSTTPKFPSVCNSDYSHTCLFLSVQLYE